MFKVDTFTSAVLGISFALIGTLTTFLMFWLWGFPFDKTIRKSEAPKALMYFHRGLGFLFLGIYVFMMVQMVPRMLAYQVEFPPRTVAHMCLAIAIGVILLVKISIIRFFRHLEEWMPVLGVLLLVCTWMLVGLSVPFSLRERQLAQNGDAFSKKNLERVLLQLTDAGLPKEASLADLATPKGLLHGRQVLLTKCVACHDLRTVLTKPRTPSDWQKTVERMGERPVIGDVISDPEQWAVTAYLVAISPDLHNAAATGRKQKQEKAEAKAAAKDGDDAPPSPVPDNADAGTLAATPALTPANAIATTSTTTTTTADAGALPSAIARPTFRASDVRPKFNKLCSQCHELDDVEKHSFKSAKDVDEVMSRMVDNGLEASPHDLKALHWYLVETYVKKK